MFLNKEVICFKDMNNNEIRDALKVYTKSLRPLFSFKICGLGITVQMGDKDSESLVNENHWVNTVWPSIATKVFSLEFFDTVKFVEGILPAMLNATQQLTVLKIHNLQYCPKGELRKVKQLQSLKELNLDNFQTDNINECKLLGIIPEHLRKICFKSMWCSKSIMDDIIKILCYSSSHLEILEFINIDVTPELMQSIASLGIKLKKFSLILADSIHYDHKPEILSPLFKTQWPLISLILRADCLTNEHLQSIANTFEHLERLSVSCDAATVNITEDGINSLASLKKLKTLYIEFGKEYRTSNAFD